MAFPMYIQDPSTGRRLRVSEDGLLFVQSIPGSGAGSLPAAALTKQKQLRSFLKNGSNSPDLNINAASTITEFNLTAQVDRTMWVTSVRVLFNDVNLEMGGNDFRRFGSATATGTPLTNGVKLFVVQGGVTTDFFINPVQRMGEFFDYSDSYLNIYNAVTSQVDFLYFDFNFDVPVVLPPGTADKIAVTVNDDLTAIDLFKVIVRGYQELL